MAVAEYIMMLSMMRAELCIDIIIIVSRSVGSFELPSPVREWGTPWQGSYVGGNPVTLPPCLGGGEGVEGKRAKAGHARTRRLGMRGREGMEAISVSLI